MMSSGSTPRITECRAPHGCAWQPSSRLPCFCSALRMETCPSTATTHSYLRITPQYSSHGGIVGYFHNISGRAFLTPVYIAIYDALGSNAWNVHILFLFLHVVNVMLCFLTLRKIFDARPALVGALFYLVYTGPYETLTWMSAGGYLIVMGVFFLCVQIALLDANAWVKGSAIALLTWLSVHLYEVLMAATPLYPLLTAVALRRKVRRIWTLDFLPTLLPLLIVSLHTLAV